MWSSCMGIPFGGSSGPDGQLGRRPVRAAFVSGSTAPVIAVSASVRLTHAKQNHKLVYQE